MKKLPNFSSVAREIIKNILAWVAFVCVVVPGVIVIFGPIYILKHYFIVPLALKLRNDLLEPLCATDEIVGQDDFYGRKCYTNLQMGIIMDGHVDIEKFRTCFAKNVLNRLNDKGVRIHEKLLLIPVQFGGYLFWKKVQDFDINHHIREDKSHISETEFQDYCSQQLTTPYSVNKPLWEITIFSNYESNKSAMVVKLHHCIADGLTFMKMLDHLIDSEPLKFDVTAKRKATWWQLANVVLKAPLEIGYLYLANMFQQNRYSRFKSSDEILISWTSIPTNELKEIKKKYDVPYAIGGLATFAGTLLQTGDNDMDENIRILLPLPWGKHPNDRMSNNWTGAFIKVPCDDEKKAEWVEEIQGSLKNIIESGANMFARYSIPLITLLPRPILKPFMYSGYNGVFLIFTTVPGRYDEDIFIAGNPVLDMIILPGLQYPHGSVAAASYNYKGRSSFSVVASKELMPNRKIIDKFTKEMIPSKCKSLRNYNLTELNENHVWTEKTAKL